MKVIIGGGAPTHLGETEDAPTIGIIDYSRRVTDEFGVTTVVERGFARRMSARLALPFEDVDGVQRLLAGLRATSAQWIADDRFAWLQPTGFYKDFDIDLALPPLSYCTLTVEGLAENEAGIDTGEDPAPDDAPSTFLMLHPLAVTNSVLTGSTVPENDATVWGAGITYAIGARVIRTGSHRIFESLTAGNIGHDPLASTHWVDVGPTNRWAMFDEALGTATTAASGTMTVTFTPDAIDGVALLDVVATSARVEVILPGETIPIYDRTILATGGAITFLDLPGLAGTVRVTVAGIGTISVGTLLIGQVLGLGITEASPSAGISDFSRKEIDAFGAVTVVQRAWAKRMSARSLIRSDALDVTANRIAAVRARPVLWIGGTGIDSVTIYGFFKDFSIEVGDTLSKLSLSIEGLSKAQPLKAPWADEIAALEGSIARIASDGYLNAGEKPQVIIDWNALNASFNALNSRYLALGSPSDITPARTEASTKLSDLTSYLDGLAPAWTDPTQDTPVVGATYQQRWVGAHTAVAAFLAAITGREGEQGSTGPQGPAGPQGPNSYLWIAYADSADGATNFTTGTPGARTYIGVSPNQASATESTNPALYTWSLIKGTQGIQGPPGPDGAPTYIWLAYADNATGTTNFTTGAPGARTYLGVAANKPTATESTNPADYFWSLIKGADGAQGSTGAQGPAGSQGPQGPTGVTLYTWFAYADSADGTVNFTTGAGGSRLYIGVAPNQTTATEGTNPASYTWSLIKGTDGIQGPQGPNGAPTYVWVAYADAADGSVNFTTGAPGARTYLGISANRTTATESTNPADYFWSLIKGADGLLIGAASSIGYGASMLQLPVVLAPSATVNVRAQLGTIPNDGSGVGSMQLQIAEQGTETWTGFGPTVNDNWDGTDTGLFLSILSASFTNSTLDTKNYKVRAFVVTDPNPPTLLPSYSFIQLTA